MNNINDYCIICLKIGTRYSSLYVNNLVKSIRKYTNRDIICFTDDPNGIDASVKIYHMDPKTFDQNTWKPGNWWPTWSKIEIFGREEIKKYTKKIYFDLDMVIQDDIKNILCHDEEWSAIKAVWKGDNFLVKNPKESIVNTSVMVWKDLTWLFDKWNSDWENIVKDYRGTDKWYHMNGFIPSWLPELFYSYREGSKPQHYWENNYQPYMKYQPEFSVCLFHQKPDIHELDPEEHIVKIWNGTV